MKLPDPLLEAVDPCEAKITKRNRTSAAEKKRTSTRVTNRAFVASAGIRKPRKEKRKYTDTEKERMNYMKRKGLVCVSCGKNAGLLKYVQEWSPGQVRKIKLTQGNGLFVPLVVHGFTVSLAFQAEDPDGWLMYNHAYGLSQLDGALLAAKRHLRERAQYDVSIMSANDKERVTALVFEGAKQLAKECKIPTLRDALYFWSAARCIEGGWCFLGTETLGVSPDANGIVPITDLLSYQFGSLFQNHILPALHSQIMSGLVAMIQKDYGKDWFTIFLTTYILLDSCERALAQQKQISIERGYLKTFTNKAFISNVLRATFNLLHYFHCYVRRSAVLTAKIKVKGLAPLDEQRRGMLDAILQAHNANANQSVPTDFWLPGYFTGQLFHTNWSSEQPTFT
ncbi:hypothetical protein H2203_005376 [Taxawa tesnikishii (nom. ined.)]|nr:hypothetical protein H2203_005376 [Dothideales sp. JES 119]